MSSAVRQAGNTPATDLKNRLIRDQLGATALTKLLSQIRIVHQRILDNMQPMAAKWRLGGPSDPNLVDTFVLDTETFYTVANDCLKLVGLFLTDDEKKRYQKESAYKAVCGIRSNLIRHAYDKRDGDPSANFAFLPDKGLVLKWGSPVQTDAGYLTNFEAFWGLLRRYGVSEESPSPFFPPAFPIVTEKFIRRLSGC